MARAWEGGAQIGKDPICAMCGTPIKGTYYQVGGLLSWRYVHPGACYKRATGKDEKPTKRSKDKRRRLFRIW